MAALWFLLEQFPNITHQRRCFSLLPTQSYNQPTFPVISVRKSVVVQVTETRLNLCSLMTWNSSMGGIPPMPTDSPRPGKAGRMEDSVDQFHLILCVRKPKPAIRNDMPSGF